MTVTVPDWLSKRGGTLRPGIDGRSWFVWFAEQPQYEVTPTPAEGKHGCYVRQTINGRPLDCKTTFATAEEAVCGGLEELRKVLGW